MSWRKCAFTVVVPILVGLSCAGAAEEPDVPALRNLAQNLHRAQAQKDVEGVLGLWSEKSPQRSAQAEQLRKLFGAPAGIEIRETTLAGPEVEANRAR